MTHFAVLVAADDVAAALAPFEEHSGRKDHSKPHLIFHDRELELLDEYLTKSVERIVMPDGSFKAPWDDEFAVDLFQTKGPAFVVPEHLERRQVPLKAMYNSLEDYALRWAGIKNRDPDMNRFGHWVNPWGKYDWFRVGGDYAGRIKLREGPPGLEGIALATSPEVKVGYADAAYFADIDFEGMRTAAEAEAAVRYDRFYDVLAGRDLPVLAEYEAKYKGDLQEAHNAYWKHPVLVFLQRFPEFQNLNYQEYEVDRATFIRRAGEASFIAYALVVDGVWYSRGHVNPTTFETINKPAAQWYTEFLDILHTLAPDTVLTLVDCHT